MGLLALRLGRQVRPRTPVKYPHVDPTECFPQIGVDDLRLGELVRQLPGHGVTLAERAASLASDSPEWEQASAALDRIRAAVRHCEQMSLDEELAAIAGTVLKGRRLAAVLHACGGVHGQPATLAEVGRRTGYSREGVRHCLRAFEEGVNRSVPFAPALDRALSLMVEVAPCLNAGYEEALVARGIARSPIPCSAVFRWARVLGRTTDGQVTLDPDGVLLLRGMMDLYERVSAELRKHAGNFGAAQVERCASRLAARDTVALPCQVIRDCVETRREFHWIHRESGWFWVPGARNPMLNDLWKVFAVCPEMDVELLHAGLSRFYRRQGTLPPVPVFLEWCQQVEGLLVSGRSVRADPPPDPGEVLTDKERLLVGLIRDHGPEVQAAELDAAWTARGENLGTLRVLRNNAPFVCRLRRGAYALRGHHPGGAEELAGASPRHGGQARGTGWTRANRVWIAYTLTERSLRVPSFPVPVVQWKVVRGEFRLRMPEGDDAGVVEARVPGGIGLQALFARVQPAAGKIMVLEFDLAERTVHAAFGDEALALRYLEGSS